MWHVSVSQPASKLSQTECKRDGDWIYDMKIRTDFSIETVDELLSLS